MRRTILGIGNRQQTPVEIDRAAGQIDSFIASKTRIEQQKQVVALLLTDPIDGLSPLGELILSQYPSPWLASLGQQTSGCEFVKRAFKLQPIDGVQVTH